MRFLITRYYPRGVKKDRFDKWVRDLSPKPDLLKEDRSGSIDWPEFVKRFKLQLKTSEESIAAMKELLELTKRRKNITLLCYEKEGEKCHRKIVKERLDSLLRRKTKASLTC
jgi:uncharacterized protein YeaO (DUF488 family)